ncbi:choice-of-anchor A domain-containing protein [Actinacidiphila yanglinensis]|uniref:Choice-of-anchor A domain-containing protein n=1 Tax=Actinacidiphila yanglinensis TaxID=310779 RepID=A0A1H6AIB5_9ACTN|nr:choice-of-anchor A family protein [Actinacidiphila yanglinensis]SEG48438.1 choice-of-anchor A domain-containing protein [Actinacidiphila yanglinensis]
MHTPPLASALVCAAGLAVACLVTLPSADSAAAAPRAAIGNPVEGNQGFGTIVEHDALLGSTETEGTVALGGDLSFGPGYNVAIHTAGSFTDAGDARPTALLVGGRVDTADSAPAGVLRVGSDGYLKIGDRAGVSVLDHDANGAEVHDRVVPAGAGYDATPRVELTTDQPTDSVAPRPGLIDFPSLFSTYRARATEIGTCAANVTLDDAQGAPLDPQTGFADGTQAYVTLTPGRTNVLHITGRDLNRLSVLTFRNQPSANTPFVVVVDTTGTGGRYSWQSVELAGAAGPQAPYMLWDFPDAHTIDMTSGDSLEGTVYAPGADFTDLDASNIEGDIVVRSLQAGPSDGNGGYVNAGEIHDFPFAGAIDCSTSPTTPPTTEPTTAPTTSPTTTPPTTPPTTEPTTTPTTSPTTEPPTTPTASPTSCPPSDEPTDQPTGGYGH